MPHRESTALGDCRGDFLPLTLRFLSLSTLSYVRSLLRLRLRVRFPFEKLKRFLDAYLFRYPNDRGTGSARLRQSRANAGSEGMGPDIPRPYPTPAITGLEDDEKRLFVFSFTSLTTSL